MLASASGASGRTAIPVDPSLPLAHGQATANAIPGAKLVVLRGVGHDFPPDAIPEYVEAVLSHLATNA